MNGLVTPHLPAPRALSGPVSAPRARPVREQVALGHVPPREKAGAGVRGRGHFPYNDFTSSRCAAGVHRACARGTMPRSPGPEAQRSAPRRPFIMAPTLSSCASAVLGVEKRLRCSRNATGVKRVQSRVEVHGGGPATQRAFGTAYCGGRNNRVHTGDGHTYFLARPENSKQRLLCGDGECSSPRAPASSPSPLPPLLAEHLHRFDRVPQLLLRYRFIYLIGLKPRSQI